jgi:hypothetical protein
MRAAGSLRVNQNFGQINPTTQRRENGKTNVSTDFSFGVNQIAPFALKGGSGRWYESFRLGLDFNGNYALANALTAIDTSYSSLGFVITDAKIDTSRLNKTKIVPFNLNNLPQMLERCAVHRPVQPADLAAELQGAAFCEYYPEHVAVG